MNEMPGEAFRRQLGSRITNHTKEFLRQAWTERSGNSDPKSVARAIDIVTEERDWWQQQPDILMRALEITTAQLTAVNATIAELREALEFYADEESYRPQIPDEDTLLGVVEIDKDEGERARRALKSESNE